MPYDPNYPPTNAPLESAPMREQFTGLKDLIDAIPTPDVTQADLNNAIETTARNCDGVAKLDMVSGDADIQTIADKVDELLDALRRNP